MDRGVRLFALLRRRTTNAVLAWALLVVVVGVAVRSLVAADPLWTVFALAVAGVAVAPSLSYRDLTVTVPWEILVVATLPLLGRALAVSPLHSQFATYLAIAALALLVVVELHAFTAVRMTTSFAVVVVVLTTMAIAGGLAVLRWTIDVATADPVTLTQRRLMVDFLSATVAGVAAGLGFEWYVRRRSLTDRSPPIVPKSGADDSAAVGGSSPAYSLVPDRYETAVSAVMGFALAAILLFGVVNRSAAIAVNSGVGLLALALPAALQRDTAVRLDGDLTLLLTTAVFLHAVGALGPYHQIWWWDHLTHTLSATVVTIVGYVGTRAVELHVPGVVLPRAFLSVYLFVFTLAAGVGWELLEYGLSVGSAAVFAEPVITQYGVDDTLVDLVFDALGAVLAAAVGFPRVRTLSATIAARLA